MSFNLSNLNTQMNSVLHNAILQEKLNLLSILSVASHYLIYNNSKVFYEKNTTQFVNMISKLGIDFRGDIKQLLPYLTSIFQYGLVFYIGREIIHHFKLINDNEYKNQFLFLHPRNWSVLNIVSVVSLLTHSFLADDIDQLSDTIINQIKVDNKYIKYLIHMFIYGVTVWGLSSLFLVCKTRPEGMEKANLAAEMTEKEEANLAAGMTEKETANLAANKQRAAAEAKVAAKRAARGTRGGAGMAQSESG